MLEEMYAQLEAAPEGAAGGHARARRAGAGRQRAGAGQAGKGPFLPCTIVASAVPRYMTVSMLFVL